MISEDSIEEIRILLVDDDQGDFEMTRAMLQQIDHERYHLDWVSSYPEAIEAFRQADHDLYIIDYFLEDRDGLQLLDEAKRLRLRAPLIMLTGRGSHQVDMEAMKTGAADYLMKGQIEPSDLDRSIRYALERHRAEEALRKSEARHRGMFDHLPVGLYRVKPDGTLMDANPALIRLLGYPDREALGEYAETLFVAPKDRSAFQGLLEQYGVARGFDTQLRRVDGGAVRVRNTARAARGPEGNIDYLEGAVEDVTDQQRAEVLQDSEARFRMVFEVTRTGIALLDLDGCFTEINPAFKRLLGFSGEELQGMPLFQLAVEEERDATRTELEGLSMGRENRCAGERRLYRKDEEIVWARLTCTLIRNPAGQPDHILAMLEDVAEVA